MPKNAPLDRFYKPLLNLIITLIVSPLLFLEWIGSLLLFLFLILLKILKYCLRFIYIHLFTIRKKERAIVLINKEQVIFGSILTSLTLYKLCKAIQIGMKRKYIYACVKTHQGIHSVLSAFVIFWRKVKYFSYGVVTISFIFIIFQADNFVNNLPNPKVLAQEINAATKIFDRNGLLLYELYEEQNRTPVKLAQIPDMVIKATIATEDKEFYIHQGISPTGIIRALYHNLTSDTVEGGSTITQQLIRSAFLTQEKTIQRKLKEMILAFWAEKIFTKNQILEMYLNQVPYGGTAWGIEAAAQTYFGKSIQDLSLPEGALLAGLPASPSQYSPFGSKPYLSKQRQEKILDRMNLLGYIDEKTAEDAKKTILTFQIPRIPIFAPHFVFYIKDLLETYYGPQQTIKGGLRVTTTLDLTLQNSVQNIVTREIDDLRRLSVGNGAVLITNPQTGEILAMVGSADYFDEFNDGNVNVTTALRPPGSSIKAVTYALALENGFTPESILDDSPVTYQNNGYSAYSPVNYDGRYHGKVTLKTALGSSYNIPAVKLLSTLGVDKMIDLGKQMGITSWGDSDRFGLSLTLGGGGVSMIDMAKVYATLANYGESVSLAPFRSITSYTGIHLPLPQQIKRQVLSPQTAFLISSILSDNDARTPAFGSNSALKISDHTVAVKTGTSDLKKDNWTIGYTPEYVVTVWVGNNDNSPMDPLLTSGITGASPIWHDIMTELLKDKKDVPFLPPDNIVTLTCNGQTQYFKQDTEQKYGCPHGSVNNKSN